MPRGKSIAIVGGTSGIGLACAERLLAAGARVVCLGKDDEHFAKARARWGEDVALVGDATAPEAAAALVQRAVERFGGLDGLVHVAGGSARKAGDGPLHELTDEGIDAALAMNLKSALYSNRAAAKAMKDGGRGGSVVNIGTALARHPEPRRFATHAYAAAKSALEGLTVAAAAYYGPLKIRFNLVAPGLVDTPMAARATGDPEIRGFLERKQPLAGGPMNPA
ncbi:MAG TPA: SDR family oxidoreductase, partial [Planctomycetia bacterium]|nr:SDR family oxidoreductase [Planctomycetia bacterium]